MLGTLAVVASRCFPVSPACPTTTDPVLPTGAVGANGQINPLAMLQPQIDTLMQKLPGIAAVGLVVGVGIFTLTMGWKLIKHFTGEGSDDPSNDPRDEGRRLDRHYST